MRYTTRPIQSPFSRNQLQYSIQPQQNPMPAPHPSQVPQNQQQNQAPRTQVKKYIGDYEFLLSDVIGQGFSSTVYLGKTVGQNDKLAIKVIDMKQITNKVEKMLLENELNVVQKLESPYIVNVKDVFQTQNNTYIVSEYCNQGDLAQLLEKRKKIPEDEAKKFLYHIVRGFLEMVSKEVIHRDLKPANIMLNNDECKIADLGFCHDATNNKKCDTYYNVGSPNYMCPQSLVKNEYSYQSDIWSIGAVYYELLYGRTPWVAQNEKELGKIIQQVPVYFPTNIEVSEKSKDFIRKCLSVNECDRFQPNDLLDHSLLREFSQPIFSKKDYQKASYNDDKMIPEIQNTYNPPTSSQQYQTNDPEQQYYRKEPTSNFNTENTLKRSEDPVAEQRKQYISNNTQQQYNSTQQTKNQDINENRYQPPALNLYNNDYQQTPETENQSNQDTYSRKSQNQQNQRKNQTPTNLDNPQSPPQSETCILINDKKILAQINYCRFLFRLYKMCQQNSILENGISQQKLDFFLLKNISQKIQKLQNLCESSENTFSLLDFSQYRQSESFQKFKTIIKEYYAKYTSAFYTNYERVKNSSIYQCIQDKNFENEFDTNLTEYPTFYNNFTNCLRQAIREMNHIVKMKVVKLQSSQLIPDGMQDQVVLIDYLVTLFQLCNLIQQNYGDYDYFAKNSKIEQIADGKPVKLTKEHYLSIRQKIYSLDI